MIRNDIIYNISNIHIILSTNIILEKIRNIYKIGYYDVIYKSFKKWYIYILGTNV